MASDVKPCPFCGQSVSVVDADPPQGTSAYVWVCCLKCLGRGPVRADKHQAISAWNERSGDA